MPSTIVKLSSSDARAWAHNQPVWLDESGEVSRSVTREEQHAIGKALERTRKTNASFRITLPLLPVAPLTRRGSMQNHSRRMASPTRTQATSIERMNCAFEVSFVGAKRVVTVFHGKLRYATGREVLAARLLADHGECVMHGRNGKCIGVLRDPLIQERAPVTGRRVQWSRNPEEAREAEDRILSGRTTVSPMQRRIKRARHAGSQRPTYSPAQCPNDCRGVRGGQAWALAKGAAPPTEQEHHPICKFAPAWAATLSPVETTDVLYDLETSTVARPAMPNEVEEAIETEARTGMRQITVQGRVYALLSVSEARQAAAEARGDGAAEPGADDGEAVRDDELDLRSDIDAEPDHRHLVEPPARTEALSTEADREVWPELDDLSPAERLRKRAEVTAKDYLSRPAPESAGA